MSASTREQVEITHAAWREACIRDPRWTHLSLRPLMVAHDTAKKAALKEFAAERGWNISSRWINPEYLRTGRGRRPQVNHHAGVIDHAQFFIANRRPAAILTHSYKSWESLVAFATTQGLNIERLPYSWYYPGGCTAALLTPKEVRAWAAFPTPKYLTRNLSSG